MKKNSKIIKNTSSLMIFNIAKMIFPFVTLPYLTRIFSTEIYGSVAYVKTVMNYMQIIIDFGFLLSATKDVVKAKEDKEKLKIIIGDTLLARIILGIFGFTILTILTLLLPILRNNLLFTLLSYVVVFETIFLMDFLFRGLEEMHIITIRFILMKIISTVLTFFLVKNDADLLLIPVLDIISSFVAIILVFYEMKKLGIKIKFSGISKSICSIKDSFMFFLSNIASTSFNALSTLVIGLKISSAEVAYWSICMQVIGSITSCYTPISDGIYPEMIKTKNISLVKRIIKLCLPIVVLGCIIVYIFSGTILNILGGQNYLVAIPIFRMLIPTLFFGFLSIMFGWPTLGAIGKTKETTFTTVSSVLIHIFLLLFLIVTNNFTLFNIAIIRSLTEMIFFCIRYFYYQKFKNQFVNL